MSSARRRRRQRGEDEDGAADEVADGGASREGKDDKVVDAWRRLGAVWVSWGGLEWGKAVEPRHRD